MLYLHACYKLFRSPRNIENMLQMMLVVALFQILHKNNNFYVKKIKLLLHTC